MNIADAIDAASNHATRFQLSRRCLRTTDTTGVSYIEADERDLTYALFQGILTQSARSSQDFVPYSGYGLIAENLDRAR